MFSRLIALVSLLALPFAALAQTPSANTARDNAWRAEIRHQLYIPDRLPALDAKVWSTFSPMPGVLADRVTYATDAGMIVPAIVYRPDPAALKAAHYKGKLPGLVIVNGHRGDKSSWYAFYAGLLFAKAGAVVVTYDPIGEYERNADKLSAKHPAAHDTIVPPPPGVSPDDWGQRLAGLMQIDVMQAVSYLDSLPEVDPKRIGELGYSMGAFVSGVNGAIDLRVHAVVLSGGGVFDGPGGYYDKSSLPCQGPPYHSLSVLGDRSAVLYDLNADRGPLLVMNGDADTTMDIPHHEADWFEGVRKRAIALRGTGADMFTTIFYPGIDHRPSWLDQDGVLWLDRQLHFPLWPTKKQIDAAGTSHIGTWAKASGAVILSSSRREDREGGVDAVGKDFPAIPRADLMVLPDADWQRLKGRLTYESWAAKTLAAERAMSTKTAVLATP